MASKSCCRKKNVTSGYQGPSLSAVLSFNKQGKLLGASTVRLLLAFSRWDPGGLGSQLTQRPSPKSGRPQSGRTRGGSKEKVGASQKEGETVLIGMRLYCITCATGSPAFPPTISQTSLSVRSTCTWIAALVSYESGSNPSSR